MQETWVQALVQEDPTDRGAAAGGAATTEPTRPAPRALQQEKPPQ